MDSIKKIILITFAASLLSSLPTIQVLAQNKPTTENLAPSLILTRLANTMVLVQDSQDLRKLGDAAAHQKDWKTALSYYQQALDKWANNQEALYGMANCVQVSGNTAKEIEYYRSAIYLDTPKGNQIQESSPNRLMEFAILLSQTGQTEEALAIYYHAAASLNYMDGKPHLKVLLPVIVEERTLPDEVRYTPERLQALAETAIAHEERGMGKDKEALAHMQEAVKLFPDSPVTHYYLGETLLATDRAGAKAAYQKAAELGDDQAQSAAKAQLKRFF